MMKAMKISYWYKPYQYWRYKWRYKYWYLGLLQFALVLLPQIARPSYAAERVIFSLGAFERSISLASIEAYVEEGRITDELAPLIAQIDPATLAQGQALLSQRLDVDVTTVAQVVYSPQGEFLLDRAGRVFRTGSRLSGKQGLSAAAILAAADPQEGLSALNMIRRFPTPVLRIDLKEGESIARQATKAFEQSRMALDLVEQLSLQMASEPFPEGVSAADLNALLTNPGLFQVKQATLKLRASELPVDIYLPEAFAGSARSPDGKYPAVVISHGVGSSRVSYAYLAQFLAQRGFAVINVEHAGSNETQIDNFVEGLTRRVVPDEEFLDRPRLISQVLQDLEARSQFNSSLSRIDFNNVGVIGQSFGGYTALAVAGAPLNLASLRSACPPDFSIDISLLLQCQALSLGDLQQSSIPFKDPRIRAVVAINPISDAVFGVDGMSQIDVPVMMISGSADTVAPALEEQIRPFTWLTTPDRYLLIMEGATHFSTIGPTGNETFQVPLQIVGPAPEIAQEYTKAMSLAFLSTYLKGDSRYQPILTSVFTNRFSRPEMPLSLISELGSDQLPPP
jgi:predicted dienelactone hydrolase